jgi:hypothetical protein
VVISPLILQLRENVRYPALLGLAKWILMLSTFVWV